MSEPEKEPEFDRRLKNLRASLEEHFPDFIVLARHPESGYGWALSDEAWALGAMEKARREILSRGESRSSSNDKERDSMEDS